LIVDNAGAESLPQFIRSSQWREQTSFAFDFLFDGVLAEEDRALTEP
jgi:hypothetical protein